MSCPIRQNRFLDRARDAEDKSNRNTISSALSAGLTEREKRSGSKASRGT